MFVYDIAFDPCSCLQQLYVRTFSSLVEGCCFANYVKVPVNFSLSEHFDLFEGANLTGLH